jgi:hypothetical protein
MVAPADCGEYNQRPMQAACLRQLAAVRLAKKITNRI